ncbi:MAG: hypothetical protein HC921_17760 [Synechococcaceae cyanobacterium SM2_3_1]|nr:hypothetical protein [Synechococcaceae cyanobacterium SM2_3_1]
MDHSLAAAEKLWSCSYTCRACWYSLWSLHLPSPISSRTLSPKPWVITQKIPIDLLIQQQRQNSVRSLWLRLGLLGSLLVHGLIFWIAMRLFQTVEPPTLAEEMIRFEMMELPSELPPQPPAQPQPIAELPPPPPAPPPPPPEPVISEPEVSLATPPPQPTSIPTPPLTPIPTAPPTSVPTPLLPVPSPVPSPPSQPASPAPVQQVPQTRFTPLINAFQSSVPNSSPLPLASSVLEPVAPSTPSCRTR